MTDKFNYNDTVYIRNINEKVSINSIKRELSKLFDKYGPVLGITAHKNLRMRGQAFVALESEENAKLAIAELNGIEIFDKKLELTLATSSSNSSVESHLVSDQYEKYLEKRKLYKEEQDKVKQTAPKKVKLDNAPPNKILLVQDLPSGVTKEELVEVFDKFEGFVEVRLVAIKRVAFIEYESDEAAIPAKEQSKNLVIRDVKPLVNYAKK